MKKKIATNSMVSTWKRCREKYALRYIDQLTRARFSVAPSFGSLFHELIADAWKKGDEASPFQTMEKWRSRIIDKVIVEAEQVKAEFGIDDEQGVEEAKEKTTEISSDAIELFQYYKKEVWNGEKDRYTPIYIEQSFEVPMVARNGNRHPLWRIAGKWDIVLHDTQTGRVVVRDYKTTVRDPMKFAMLLELDTQPILYFYASRYLQAYRGKDKKDFPVWPQEVNPIGGFELEIIRKKVPKEPPLLKKGGLSKAQNIDTTPELFRQAINKNRLNEADYADVLERLENRGPAFHYRHKVEVDANDVGRWVDETRNTLEDIRAVDLDRSRAYRADSMTCQNQYGRRCEYHTLCYGDAEAARSGFVVKPPHSELLEEEEID
jgi:hypothetical protein